VTQRSSGRKVRITLLGLQVVITAPMAAGKGIRTRAMCNSARPTEMMLPKEAGQTVTDPPQIGLPRHDRLHLTRFALHVLQSNSSLVPRTERLGLLPLPGASGTSPVLLRKGHLRPAMAGNCRSVRNLIHHGFLDQRGGRETFWKRFCDRKRLVRTCISS
jgi:hypothetical protein